MASLFIQPLSSINIYFIMQMQKYLLTLKHFVQTNDETQETHVNWRIHEHRSHLVNECCNIYIYLYLSFSI